MKKIFIIFFLCVGFMLTGCGNQTIPADNQNQATNQNQSAETANETEISIQNFTFVPADLSTTKGTTVTWINNDSAPHQIKSDTFNSNRLSKGEIFSFTFNETGDYDYVCAIHSNMKGKITVK